MFFIFSPRKGFLSIADWSQTVRLRASQIILKTYLGELWILYRIGLNWILSFGGSDFIFSNFTSAKVEYNNELIERSSFRFFSSKRSFWSKMNRIWKLNLVHLEEKGLFCWTVPWQADLWLFLDIKEYFGLHLHLIDLITWINLFSATVWSTSGVTSNDFPKSPHFASGNLPTEKPL